MLLPCASLSLLIYLLLYSCPYCYVKWLALYSFGRRLDAFFMASSVRLPVWLYTDYVMFDGGRALEVDPDSCQAGVLRYTDFGLLGADLRILARSAASESKCVCRKTFAWQVRARRARRWRCAKAAGRLRDSALSCFQAITGSGTDAITCRIRSAMMSR